MTILDNSLYNIDIMSEFSRVPESAVLQEQLLHVGATVFNEALRLAADGPFQGNLEKKPIGLLELSFLLKPSARDILSGAARAVFQRLTITPIPPVELDETVAHQIYSPQQLERAAENANEADRALLSVFRHDQPPLPVVATSLHVDWLAERRLEKGSSDLPPPYYASTMDERPSKPTLLSALRAAQLALETVRESGASSSVPHPAPSVAAPFAAADAHPAINDTVSTISHKLHWQASPLLPFSGYEDVADVAAYGAQMLEIVLMLKRTTAELKKLGGNSSRPQQRIALYSSAALRAGELITFA